MPVTIIEEIWPKISKKRLKMAHLWAPQIFYKIAVVIFGSYRFENISCHVFDQIGKRKRIGQSEMRKIRPKKIKKCLKMFHLRAPGFFLEKTVVIFGFYRFENMGKNY